MCDAVCGAFGAGARCGGLEGGEEFVAAFGGDEEGFAFAAGEGIAEDGRSEFAADGEARFGLAHLKNKVGGREERGDQGVEIFAAALVIPAIDLHLKDRAIAGERGAGAEKELSVVAFDVDFDCVDANARIPDGVERLDVSDVCGGEFGRAVNDGAIHGEWMLVHGYIGD